MYRLTLFIICMFLTISGMSRIPIAGNIIEVGSNEPLAGASVILRNPEGKISKYATSDVNGCFSISTPEITGYVLDVSVMGFAGQTVRLDSVQLPVTIVMEASVTMLREVTVKADAIREQGDTITYNVGSFAQPQDRSIGDVLKHMPGIEVSSSGKIQYQGEDINKFYIEGSDLLGGRYGIAANGISHDDVGAVEVLENHQPMQVLSGISFSNKAAINLKLKNKAKATWSFHGDAGGGCSWQPEGAIWEGELFAMAAMPDFQNITTFKTNNVGKDLTAQAADYFSSPRGTGLSRYVGVSLPGVPNLSRKRTLFNRSALVSTNVLRKLGRGEVKAQIDYSFNRVTAGASNITTYFLNDSDRIVTEDRNGVDRTHSISCRFIYELNQKTAYINNTLKTNIDLDDVRLRVSGSLPNDQTASLPDYYAGNDFKLIKRFKGKHLVTFISKNEWESMPQTLSVSMNDSPVRQHINDHAFHTSESTAYAFSVKGMTISLEGGVRGYFRSLNTELPKMPEAIPGATTNALNTNCFTVYATPGLEYRVRRVNFSLDAPVSFASYTFDKALANRRDVYFSPSLSIYWKPGSRFSMSLRGGAGRSPMDLSLIQTGYVMTDYRSFCCGVDDFYNSTSQNVSASFSYKHTRRGLFANAFAMQSWSHNPYTPAQQLYGDYVVYSYTSAKSDSRMLMASGNIGKTLDFMRGCADINGSFSRHESHLISENKSINSVGTSWSIGAGINGAPLRWLSFDYRFNFSSNHLAMDGTNASRLGNMKNELMINIMPHKKMEWHICGEHYRNELATGNFTNVFLLDTKLVYKPGKRLELSADINNILNIRSYNYITYSRLSSFESKRWLRGRELLFTLSFRN